jgi:chromosome partitioning protein
MAVIVVASNKGGVGKTTVSLLLAEEMAHRGYRVALVEADRESHVERYLAAREDAAAPLNFDHHGDRDPDTLGRTIRTADDTHHLVIVDLPGVTSLLFTRAVARANLVLVPMNPATMDANSASAALGNIEIESEHLQRRIEHRIVLNMVQDASRRDKAIALDATERALRHHLTEADYPKLDAELTLRRGAFRRYYDVASTLREMALENRRNASLANAIAEVETMADEVLGLLGMSVRAPRAAAE